MSSNGDAPLGASHRTMRQLNRTVVLDLVRDNSPISRAEIAKAANLAKPTVSAIVEELIRDDLVVEIGHRRDHPVSGRPPMLLEFNARSRFVAGVHLGVRHLEVTVADATGTPLATSMRPTPRAGVPVVLDTIVAAVNETLRQVGDEGHRLSAVGVCIPGLLDLDTGVCLLAPNLGWRDEPVRGPLEAALGVPCLLHNTHQAAAVAEAIDGVGHGADDVLFLYAGTGVGVGIITGGRLFRGAFGMSGEIGHCRVPGATQPCGCGQIGCLETVASGPAIVTAAQRAIAAGRQTSIAPSSRTLGLRGEDVAAAADAGDELACEIMTAAGRTLGMVASWLVNTFNPPVLVLGGGLMEAGDVLVGPLRDAVHELSLPQASGRLDVRRSRLGQGAETRGAVLVALQHTESSYRLLFHS